MKTKIKLDEMLFYAFHGYYEEEQKIGNQFILNVDLEIDSFDEANDQIKDTVNYVDVYKICKEEMAQTQKLLETVAFRIVKKIKQIKHVDKASVRISKMHPKMGGPIKSATVEMSE